MQLWEMLKAGGLTAEIMGIAGVLCTVWGVYQLRNPPQKRQRVLHVFCSVTPALMGLWMFYRMFSAYQLIAQSMVAPTRQEYDLIMSHSVILGSLSILCTMIPLGVSFAGLIKRDSTRDVASKLSPET